MSNEIYNTLRDTLLGQVTNVNNAAVASMGNSDDIEKETLRNIFKELITAREDTDKAVEELYTIRHKLYSSLLTANVSRYYSKNISELYNSLKKYIIAKNALNINNEKNSLSSIMLSISNILGDIYNNSSSYSIEDILQQTASLKKYTKTLSETLSNVSEELGYGKDFSFSLELEETSTATDIELPVDYSLYGFSNNDIVSISNKNYMIKRTTKPSCNGFTYINDDTKIPISGSIIFDTDVAFEDKNIKNILVDISSGMVIENGSAEAPYLIHSIDDFKTKGVMNSSINTHFKLMSDIEVYSDTYNNTNNILSGIFDGNYHTITTNYPFFNEILGTVKNLKIEIVESETMLTNPLLIEPPFIKVSGMVTNVQIIYNGNPHKNLQLSELTIDCSELTVYNELFSITTEIVINGNYNPAIKLKGTSSQLQHVGICVSKIDADATRPYGSDSRIVYLNENSTSDYQFDSKDSDTTGNPSIPAGTTYTLENIDEGENGEYIYSGSSTETNGLYLKMYLYNNKFSGSLIFYNVDGTEIDLSVDISGNLYPLDSDKISAMDSTYKTIFSLAELIYVLSNAKPETLLWNYTDFPTSPKSDSRYLSYKSNEIMSLVSTVSSNISNFLEDSSNNITDDLNTLNKYVSSFTQFESYRQSKDSNYSTDYTSTLTDAASLITGYIESIDSLDENYETSTYKADIENSIKELDSVSTKMISDLSFNIKRIEEFIDCYAPFFKIDDDYGSKAQKMMDAFDETLDVTDFVNIPNYIRKFNSWKETISKYSDGSIFNLILMYASQELGMCLNKYNILDASSTAECFRSLFNHAFTDSLKKCLFDDEVISENLLEILDSEKFIKEEYGISINTDVAQESISSVLKSLVKGISEFEYIDLTDYIKNRMNNNKVIDIERYVKTIFIQEIFRDKKISFEKIQEIMNCFDTTENNFKMVFLKAIYKKLLFDIYKSITEKMKTTSSYKSIFSLDELNAIKQLTGSEMTTKLDESENSYDDSSEENEPVIISELSEANIDIEKDILSKYLAVWNFYNNDSNSMIVFLEDKKNNGYLYNYLINSSRVSADRDKEESLNFWEKTIKFFKDLWDKIVDIFV